MYEKAIKESNEVDRVVELDLGDGSIVTSELVTRGDGLRSTARKAFAPTSNHTTTAQCHLWSSRERAHR
jgi:2-polyprenyl-6-methoxyphenol hydroxylase-like FAD-dependent oxidoreductase